MNRVLIGLAALTAASLTLTGCKSTGDEGSTASAGPARVIVNSNCPIGREPVVETVATVSHKGASVGFCCEGCKSMWPTLSDAEKDLFVRQAIAGNEPGIGG